MKRILFLLTCLVLSTIGAVAQQQKLITLEDITSGQYYAERIWGVVPTKDGETYTQLSEDSRQIIRKSFKTGEQVGVVFDVSTARGPRELSSIDDYVMSPDESCILLQTETKSIYRRSFTAHYYIYNVSDGTFTELSEGGAAGADVLPRRHEDSLRTRQQPLHREPRRRQGNAGDERRKVQPRPQRHSRLGERGGVLDKLQLLLLCRLEDALLGALRREPGARVFHADVQRPAP